MSCIGCTTKVELLPRIPGCFSLWCPCILYGKTQERRSGKENTWLCVKQVISSLLLWIYISFRGRSLTLSFRVLVVAFSLAAISNLYYNLLPAAACAASTISMVTHAMIALSLGAVLAVCWYKRIKRRGKESACKPIDRDTSTCREWLTGLSSMWNVGISPTIGRWYPRMRVRNHMCCAFGADMWIIQSTSHRIPFLNAISMLPARVFVTEGCFYLQYW